MISPEKFIKCLSKNKINFFTGVPDSLFKSLCIYLEKKQKKKNFVAANEGCSVGLAIGYYLANKKLPLVYLQNSGLGNTVNPLISMANDKVYSIPLFLLVGWRGELYGKKQIKDEPQHNKQGIITEKLLKLLDVKYEILDKNLNLEKVIKKLSVYAIRKNKPVALLVRKNIFENNLKKKIKSSYFSREDALKSVIKNIPKNSIKISTTGMLSRELNELNLLNNTTKNTFMCVGGMGHAISIASGIAASMPKKRIYCFDGDGSFLMHLGASTTSAKLKNIIHIVFNNKSHDSVGGHLTSAPDLNLKNIATNLGYDNSLTVKSEKELNNIFKYKIKRNKNIFLEIICSRGNRKNLSRPKKSLKIYKQDFMKFISK